MGAPHPADVDTRWRYRGPAPSYRVEMATEGEGHAAGRIAYLGPHAVERVEGTDQTIALVVPDAVGQLDPAVADSLGRASRELDVGARDGVVTAFAVPASVSFPGYSGVEYRNAFWIRATQPVDAPGNLWVHEYVHARQGYAPAESMEWLDEGAADYYAALVTLRAGDVSFDSFYAYVGSSLYPGATLTDPATWATPSVEYEKGRVVVAALDARLRRATDGERTFDDVYRRLNAHEGELDYADFRRIVVDVGNESFGPWLDEHVAGSGQPSVPADPSLWGVEPETTGDDADTTTGADGGGPTDADDGTTASDGAGVLVPAALGAVLLATAALARRAR